MFLSFIWIFFLLFIFVSLNQKQYNREKIIFFSLIYLGFISFIVEISIRNYSGLITFISCISLFVFTIIVAMNLSRE
jgi:hypothetical protein